MRLLSQVSGMPVFPAAFAYNFCQVLANQKLSTGCSIKLSQTRRVLYSTHLPHADVDADALKVGAVALRLVAKQKKRKKKERKIKSPR